MRDNRAVSVVMAYLMAMMIIFGTITGILAWGIPYIEDREREYQLQAAFSQFDILDKKLTSLIQTGAGVTENIYIENSNDKGSIIIDEKANRMIIYYSFNESSLDFNVSGLDDDDREFNITTKPGQSLDNITIYWLNDTCFLAETKVAMADGSYKNIEDIRIGDFVKSYDEQNKVLVNCKVTQVHHHTPEEMPEYYLVINNELKVTPNHKFYSNGEWIYAGDLKVGDPLFCKEIGKYYLVNSIKKVYEKVQTYDLTVKSCHNFFVNVEDVDVLVHNTPYKPLKSDLKGNVTINSPTPSYVSLSSPISIEDAPYPMSFYDNSTYTGHFYNISIVNISTNNTGTYYYNFSFNWSVLTGTSYSSQWNVISNTTMEYNFTDRCTLDQSKKLINISIPQWWYSSGYYKLAIQLNVSEGGAEYNKSAWSRPYYFKVNSGCNFPPDILKFNTTFPIPLLNTSLIESHSSTSYGENYTIKIPDSSLELKGAVRIDLYNSSTSEFTLNGTLPSGRIWLFDLGYVKNSLPFSDGVRKMIFENGAVILFNVDEERFINEPGFFETSDAIGLRLIITRCGDVYGDHGDTIAGAGTGVYKLHTTVKSNFMRELENRGTYNFTIQIYGENDVSWINYYLEMYSNFELIDNNTIRYKTDGKKFLFATGIFKISLGGIV